jgi:hypothetical protein
MTGLWRGPWRARRGLGARVAENVEVYDLGDFDTVELLEFKRMVADGWPAKGAYDLVQRRRAERAKRCAQQIVTPEAGEGAGDG